MEDKTFGEECRYSREGVQATMIAEDEEKWTVDDVHRQRGRVAVITGADSGVGFEVARVLASWGASVVLAVRDLDQGHQAAAQVARNAFRPEVSVQRLDLSSLESVRDAAAELRARLPKIDLLVNHAAVMRTSRCTTEDGFELQFGTNHLAHFALTGLLLEKMLSAPGSRVVTVSGAEHRLRARIHFEDLQWERSYDPIAAYGQSKLANLMFAYELQRRLSASHATTIAVAAHPGYVQADLNRDRLAWARVLLDTLGPLFAQSAAMGALPLLRAATDPSVRGGQYYGPDGFLESKGYPIQVESSEPSHDTPVQRRLWSMSEELTGVHFPV
jgi:NAD(P)-dependent dehydrogenase (short-subunit alcohol dehydrogenase family)